MQQQLQSKYIGGGTAGEHPYCPHCDEERLLAKIR